MFLLYLQYLLIDFRQTFVTGAAWDTDDLITFLGQKFKVQGHTIVAKAHSTRRYRRVQLFLVILTTRVIICVYTIPCEILMSELIRQRNLRDVSTFWLFLATLLLRMCRKGSCKLPAKILMIPLDSATPSWQGTG